ncbi:hypothetical protein WDU94_010805 [Cyamophila willieti]
MKRRGRPDSDDIVESSMVPPSESAAQVPPSESAPQVTRHWGHNMDKYASIRAVTLLEQGQSQRSVANRLHVCQKVKVIFVEDSQAIRLTNMWERPHESWAVTGKTIKETTCIVSRMPSETERKKERKIDTVYPSALSAPQGAPPAPQAPQYDPQGPRPADQGPRDLLPKEPRLAHKDPRLPHKDKPRTRPSSQLLLQHGHPGLTKETCLTPKTPDLLPMNPLLPTKAPDLLPMDPRLPTKAPDLLPMDPRLPTKAPDLLPMDPRLPTKAPDLLPMDPRLPTKAPDLFHMEPRLLTKAPRLPSKAPRLPTKAPDLTP